MHNLDLVLTFTGGSTASNTGALTRAIVWTTVKIAALGVRPHRLSQ